MKVCYLNPIMSHCMTSLLKLEITVCMIFWLSLPVHSGSLKSIDYPKQICLAHILFFNVFTAFKGTHFYILFVHSVTLIACVVRKRIVKTASNFHKWLPRYCIWKL